MSIDLDAPIGGEQEVDIQELESNLAKLEQSLVNRDPDFKNLLALIHKELIKKPELGHMLKPEQINTYVQASQRFTTTTIVMDSARKRTGAKVSDVSLDDL